MGDIVFTLPAFHAIRSALPGARISYLVSQEYKPVLEGIPGINSILAIDRTPFRRLHLVQGSSEIFSLVLALRRQHLRLTIDFQGYGETAFLSRLSGAPERWGTVYRFGRRWAYTGPITRRGDLHPADNCLQVLKQNGFPVDRARGVYTVPARARHSALKFFEEHGLRVDRPTLFVQPLTSSVEKNWLLDRYLSVAHWANRKGWQILFGGGPAERARLAAAEQAGFAVAAGVSLSVSIGLVSLSSLVLGGDTGLVHLAVAMDKRVVMVMRYLMAGSPHPYQHRDWAVTPPPKASLRSLPHEAVTRACLRAMSELRGDSGQLLPAIPAYGIPKSEFA